MTGWQFWIDRGGTFASINAGAALAGTAGRIAVHFPIRIIYT